MPPATNANGVHGDKHVAAQFTIIYPTKNCGFISKKGQCKHCKTPPKSWNITTHQKPHLATCQNYQAFRTASGLDIISASKKQPTIADRFLNQETSPEDLFALAIYTSTSSFS
jgi:hypothetical protein